MKLTRIAAAIVLATTMAGAFGATSDEKATDQTPAATTAHQWYQAGDRERQSEQGKAELDRAGFPQYAE